MSATAFMPAKASAPSFVPMDSAFTRFHLDINDRITKDGQGNTLDWQAQGENGPLFQYDIARIAPVYQGEALNGMPGLYFTQGRLSVPLVWGERTIYMVVKQNGPSQTGYNGFFGQDIDPWYYFGLEGLNGGGIETFFNYNTYASGFTRNDQVRLLKFMWAGGKQQVSVNGVPGTEYGGFTFPTVDDTFSIGRTAAGAGSDFHGWMGDVVGCNGLVPAQDDASITDYLMNKFSIS